MNAHSPLRKTKSTNRQRYIWAKPNARYLWFQMWVPERYRSVETRKVVQCCLGTTDRHDASIRAGKIRADLHEEWAQKLAELSGSDNAPAAKEFRQTPTLLELRVAAAEDAYVAVVGKLQKLLQSKRTTDQLVDSLGGHWKRLLRTRSDEARHIWEGVADRAILRNHWMLPKGDDLYRHFIEMISEAGIEALRVEHERLEGKFNAKPRSPVVVAGLAKRTSTAAAGERLMDLFERYAAQRLAEKRKRLDTINQDRKVIQQFQAFVGEERSIKSITRIDVREWRDAVTALPPNYRKMKSYAGLSIKDAAARARELGAAGVSPTTVNKYLSTVSPLFAWCRTNGYADENPCEGLFYDAPKGRNPRPPFSTTQLNAILSSPLFTGFLRDGREHVPGDQEAGDWRYWIPLVCLFSGARVGEIAQLHVQDVKQEHGIWFLHIREDESTGQQTKSRNCRPVPVHSKLLALGFLMFVERQRASADADSNPRLFPELEPNDRGQIGGTPSRFWRDYLRRIGVKAGADGTGAHSFRHTMADQLRLADFLDDEIEVALGHNQKTVTSGYGQLKQGTVRRLHQMFEAAQFEGVKIEHLFEREGRRSPRGV